MELTEFEQKFAELVQNYGVIGSPDLWIEFLSKLRKIMPLTCTPNERAFLDEIREKYELKNETTNGVKYVYLSNAPSLIYQSDFTKTNLSELVEVKG